MSPSANIFPMDRDNKNFWDQVGGEDLSWHSQNPAGEDHVREWQEQQKQKKED